MRPRTGVFYGWWIVIAGAASQAYASGAFWQGFGAFFDPIVAQFHWSRAVTAAAVSIQRTETGVIAPFVGHFIDRYGSRQVMLGGTLIMGLGFVLLSRIQNLWQFYGAFILITLGMAFGTFMVVITAMTHWFVAKRARAMGITMAGTGLGGLLVPLLILLIEATSWRTGLVVVGIGFWVVGIPAALVMRGRPEEHGYLPDGRAPGASEQAVEGATPGAGLSAAEMGFTVREALLSRSFWQMAAALGVGQLAMSASVHQIPALTSFGVSRTTAGLVIASVSVVSTVGRVGTGFLGDWMDKRRVIAAAFACQSIGLLAFAYTGSIWNILGFTLFWGLGWGGSVPVRFALLADYFGRRSYGSIMGVMSTVSTVFGVAGPVLVGWMADVRGNYRDPFVLMALTVLISVPIIMTLKAPVARARQAATP